MRSFMMIILIVLVPLFNFAQSNGEKLYRYTVDLTRVINDRIYVELIPPATKEKQITFYFPKIVPGTYSIADYGRYISELKALDKKGKPLPVEKVDDNS